MNALRSGFSCVAVLVATSLTFAANGDETALRYRFKEGEVIRYVMEEKTNAEVGGQKIDVTSIVDLKWRIDKVNKDGSVTLTQTIERVRMDSIIGETKSTFDSKAGVAPVDAGEKRIANSLNAFVGGEMILSLDAKGMIESLKFTKTLQDTLDKLAPDEQAVTKFLSEDNVRRFVAESTPPLPNESPSSDKPWQSKFSTTLEGTAKMTLDYKHAYAGSVSRGGKKLDKIVTAATITVEDGGDPDVSIKVAEQEVKSIAHVDRTLGRLVDSEYSLSLVLEIKALNETIRMKAARKTTFKLVVPK